MSGSRRRNEQRSAESVVRRAAVEHEPIPGLAEYASGAGWSGPLPDPEFGDAAVLAALQTLVRAVCDVEEPAVASEHDGATLARAALRFANCYSRTDGDRRFTIGNAFLPMNMERPDGGATRAAWAAAVSLTVPMPGLLVTPRSGAHGRGRDPQFATYDSDFDATFTVHAASAEIAERLTPEIRAVIGGREDWGYAATPGRLCAAGRSLIGSVEAFATIVDSVARVARALEHESPGVE